MSLLGYRERFFLPDVPIQLTFGRLEICQKTCFIFSKQEAPDSEVFMML